MGNESALFRVNSRVSRMGIGFAARAPQTTREGTCAPRNAARQVLAWRHKLVDSRMQSHFNHLALYVADLKRSTTFYRDVIGADRIPDPFQDDRHVWFKIGEHNQLHLIAGTDPGIGNMHFAFAVSSLDDFLKHLNRFAISHEDGKGKAGKVRIRPDGVKQIYLQDPDGYWIEINEDRY